MIAIVLGLVSYFAIGAGVAWWIGRSIENEGSKTGRSMIALMQVFVFVTWPVFVWNWIRSKP